MVTRKFGAIYKSGLKMNRDRKQGYQAHTQGFVDGTKNTEKQNETLEGGPVQVNEVCDGIHLAARVWEELICELFPTRNSMKKILKIFGAQESEMSPFIKNQYVGDVEKDIVGPLSTIFPKSAKTSGGQTEDTKEHPIDTEKTKDAIFAHLVKQCLATINQQDTQVGSNAEIDSEEDENADTLLDEDDQTAEDTTGDEEEDLEQKIVSALDVVMKSKSIEEFPAAISKAMALLDLGKREGGSKSLNTKAMSLNARYFLKLPDDDRNAGESDPMVTGALVRDAVVTVKHINSEGNENYLHYRILGIFDSFMNKWFMKQPSKKLQFWRTGQAAPKLRLTLRLLERTLGGDGKYMYSTVKHYETYKPEEVQRSIKASDICSWEGYLAAK